ncbi:MAG: glutathione S-transferase family protein [Rhodobacter sp.]|nr:glutathione S-transferase family protein [Rhodobacter sp.]
MPILYHDVNAVCCQKVEMALAEKDVTYDEKIISLFKNEQYSKEYLQINGRGIVPTFVDDGATIIESTVICEYIEDRFPGPALMPADPFGRASVRVWTKRVDEEIHRSASVLSFCAMFRDRMLAMPREEREMRYANIGDPVREDMYRGSVERGLDSPAAVQSIALYERLMADMEKSLQATGPWLAGSLFSLADIGLASYFARLHYLGIIDVWLGDRPQTAAWWERLMARQSYRRVIDHALTDAEKQEMSGSGTKLYDRFVEIHRSYLDRAAHPGQGNRFRISAATDQA